MVNIPCRDARPELSELNPRLLRPGFRTKGLEGREGGCTLVPGLFDPPSSSQELGVAELRTRPFEGVEVRVNVLERMHEAIVGLITLAEQCSTTSCQGKRRRASRTSCFALEALE